MRGIVQRCASPVRMSRTNMALLMRVPPTASQVLMTDSKFTSAEARKVNLLAVDAFQAVATRLVPTLWNQCYAWFFADLGWLICSGALALIALSKLLVNVQISVLAGWIAVGLGSRHVVGRGSSPRTFGTRCLRYGAWNGWWQCPSTSSEQLSSSFCAHSSSPLWTMVGII